MRETVPMNLESTIFHIYFEVGNNVALNAFNRCVLWEYLYILTNNILILGMCTMYFIEWFVNK